MDATRLGFWCRLDNHHAMFFIFYELFVSQTTNAASHWFICDTMVTQRKLELRIFQPAFGRIGFGNHCDTNYCSGYVLFQF